MNSMVHWNNKICISLYINSETSAIALDSNFNMRKGVLPLLTAERDLPVWLETLGPHKGLYILLWGQDQEALARDLLEQYPQGYTFIDVRSIVQFCNDRAAMRAEDVLFTKPHKLQYIDSSLQINEVKGPWQRARQIAKAYKELTLRGLI